jgi:hypothetical protein
MTSLWDLDARLSAQIGATREPALAQIRLRWWQTALAGLESGTIASADPLLERLAAVWPKSAVLVALADMWEAWLCRSPEESVAIAARRGEILFSASARALGGVSQQDHGGACWSCVDRALASEDDEERQRLFEGARAQFSGTCPDIPALAMLDGWALRLARRDGRNAPMRDGGWLFVRGMGALFRPVSV